MILQYPCGGFKKGMHMLSRRTFIGAAAGAPLVAIAAGQSMPAASGAALISLTADAKAISVDERRARLAKLQGLMEQDRLSNISPEFAGRDPNASRSPSYRPGARSLW